MATAEKGGPGIGTRKAGDDGDAQIRDHGCSRDSPTAACPASNFKDAELAPAGDVHCATCRGRPWGRGRIYRKGTSNITKRPYARTRHGSFSEGLRLKSRTPKKLRKQGRLHLLRKSGGAKRGFEEVNFFGVYWTELQTRFGGANRYPNL